MQAHLHMQLRNRLFRGRDKADELGFANCQGDPMLRQDLGEEVLALLRQRMRIDDSDTELEGLAPKPK